MLKKNIYMLTFIFQQNNDFNNSKIYITKIADNFCKIKYKKK